MADVGLSERTLAREVILAAEIRDVRRAEKVRHAPGQTAMIACSKHSLCPVLPP